MNPIIQVTMFLVPCHLMLRPDKYTTIEIGIVLTCRISTPQSLMFTN